MRKDFELLLDIHDKHMEGQLKGLVYEELEDTYGAREKFLQFSQSLDGNTRIGVEDMVEEVCHLCKDEGYINGFRAGARFALLVHHMEEKQVGDE